MQGVVGRLLEALRLPYQLDDHEVVMTGSLGVATSTTGYDRAEDMLRDADIAMYRAKSTARGSYATFEASMHSPAMDRPKTETELRQAIEGSAHAHTGLSLIHILVPSERKTSSKAAVNFVSRSRRASALRLRACWVAHSPTGLAVTPER